MTCDQLEQGHWRLAFTEPETEFVLSTLARLGRLGLAVTLFLIGTGINRETIRSVGAKPMIQGVLLWIVVGSVSLWAIVEGWIHL